ncbi:hypothetical protein BDV98DRAFT_659516 [Pterulicium gracile]|uniref:GST N-terminal domain-containing protein n=1 Tax=Pterulicium gracile TaxID=1884261 RepID=A0A5C3Q202_9AGAR|nr:hypothetical protein BDV98DRAFT_659516 [Pterula gracilis]
MDASNPMILYDIPSPHSNQACSQSSAAPRLSLSRSRYCLNYKGLQHRIEWVELPDLTALYERLNLPAVRLRGDITYHPVPVISDPSTGSIVSDSLNIARYLDETYTYSPRLISQGCTLFIHAFEERLRDSVRHVFKLITCEAKLNEARRDFYEHTRPLYFGVLSFQDMNLTGEARSEELRLLQADLERFTKLYDVKDEGGYVMGDTLDIVVAAMMKWFSLHLPEREELKRWSEGRWAKVLVSVDGEFGQMCASDDGSQVTLTDGRATIFEVGRLSGKNEWVQEVIEIREVP